MYAKQTTHILLSWSNYATKAFEKLLHLHDSHTQSHVRSILPIPDNPAKGTIFAFGEDITGLDYNKTNFETDSFGRKAVYEPSEIASLEGKRVVDIASLNGSVIALTCKDLISFSPM